MNPIRQSSVSVGTSDREPSRDSRRWWVNAWRPSGHQASYELRSIEGEVPRELYGTLYRNGPSQNVLPAGGYEALHLFDGDALMHAFRFDDGRVHYTGRFVEDPTHVIEREEGRYCASGVALPADQPSDRLPIRQQHNTNVVWHGGKLLALVENAYPFEIDPRDLGPVGETDFGGKMLGMSVSAHPKIDGKTGQMLIHGYQPFEPFVQLYGLDPDGTCSMAVPIDVPYPAMMHELAITEHYVLFLLCPIVMDAAPLMEGKPFAQAIAWEPERGMRFGVMPRAGGSIGQPIQWFDAPTVGFIFHVGNAYEDGERIVMDACTYPDGGALLETLKSFRSGRTHGDWYARPHLYELDLRSGRCTERKLDERSAEFPRIDDRLVGYRNRFGYATRGRGGAEADPWSVVVRYDREGGPSQAHDFGYGHWPSEPVFVPRAADAAEGDGFVLCTVYDGPEDASYLAVLDASNLDAAPLATAYLEQRIPMGFHGNFAAGVV